jgi:uncharacterized protein (TIGR03643 family)
MNLTTEDIDRIVEMAWEDRTPFEAIEWQFGLSEPEVIQLMRNILKDSSFRRWRRRVSGRSSKHLALRTPSTQRFRCSRQRDITLNRISKR